MERKNLIIVGYARSGVTALNRCLAGVTIKNPNEEVMFYLRPPKVITVE